MSTHRRLHHVLSILVIFTMLFSGVSLPSAAAQEALDPSNVLDASFGGDGIVTTDFGGYELGESLALQPDGKIILTGSFYYYDHLNQSHHDFALSRYNANGSLDTTFNTDGKVTLDLGGQEEAYDVALQPDGKIIVAGNSYNGSSSNFVLLRYNPNGSLDTTFSGDGKILTNIIHGVDVAVQSDGKIVVAGHWYNGEKSGFSLVRYNSDGLLDTTFDGDGKAITYFANSAHGSEIAIQPDGRIVVIGYSYIGPSNYDFALARYNSNGSLDTTFDADGKVNMDFGGDDTTSGVAIQPDGKIVVVGTRNNGNAGVDNDFVLARYNSDGSLDTTFDADGKVILRLGFGDIGTDIALQSNGRILMLGSAAHVSPGFSLDYDFALLRFNHDGSLDTTFDTDGMIILDLSPYDPADEIALQPDGKIVLSGGTLNANDDFALVRYIGDLPSLIVTKTADTNDGVCNSDCSLREAIQVATSGETVKFHSSLAGQTVTLSSTLVINKDLTIDGSELTSLISISGDNNVRVFEVDPSVTAVIDSLIIKNGKVDGAGAGIYNSGTLTVANSLLSANRTEFDPTVIGLGLGGAIYSENDLTITNSVFTENVGSRGGAIYCNGTMTVIDSTFHSNSASSESGDGGAIFENCDLSIVNSTFSSNTAEHNGGAILTDNDLNPVIIANSTFYNNTAMNVAGGIANYGGLIVTNSTFSHNSSTSGGAIRNGLGGVLSLRNSILANSVNTADCIKSDGSHEIDNLNNLIETTGSGLESCGTSLLTGDPILGALQNNGGFTETMALGASSPAIDAGNDMNCPAHDQRGFVRPQGNHCDIGAYEAKGPIEVNVGATDINSYSLVSGQSQKASYPGINNGPVKIIDTRDTPLIGAERVIYKVKGVQTSFTELMGLPEGQLDNVYWLPWYNNKDLDTQLRIANATDNPATVTVTIGGVEMPTLNLAAGESTRVSYQNVNDGPVKIESNQEIVAAERVIYTVQGVQTSFSEMMALPESQLDKTYWLPWYNNLQLDTQLRIANVTDQPATVQVTIGGVTMAPLNLAAGESTRVSYTDVNDGPVQIKSNVDIVAAERVIYKVNKVQTSFSEMMALPESQLDTTYWLPWYNNKDLDTQLRIGNVSGSTATIHVFIGGNEVTPVEGITVSDGESTRLSYPSVNDGPVQIISDQNIVVAERVIYKVKNIQTSFCEMMALPASQLDTTYWFPWYNNLGLDTQLRFGVP